MPDNEKGYTLIELIVVVVLLGIFFSFTAPIFRDAVLTDDMKSATLRLMGKIQELRSNAVRKQIDHYLKFDLEKNEFWHEYTDVTAEGSELAHDTHVEYLPRGIRFTDIWIRGNGKVMSGETAIRFTKKGYARQSAIHLESEDGQECTVIVNPFLPNVEVIEKYIEFEDM